VGPGSQWEAVLHGLVAVSELHVDRLAARRSSGSSVPSVGVGPKDQCGSGWSVSQWEEGIVLRVNGTGQGEGAREPPGRARLGSVGCVTWSGE
jgi:hypothetical protein